jgi:non-specific serine/threonine protein kinase
VRSTGRATHVSIAPEAIKFLPRVSAEDQIALDRFRREARAASALNHPRICTVYDVGEHQGRPFFVMEFLEGQSIRDRIGDQPAPIPELVDVALQICDALQAAHATGIVHRDIKPANIFVTAGGQVKILDFGLAKFGAESSASRAPIGEADETVTGVTLTRPGSVLGTLAYLSPEQARGEKWTFAPISIPLAWCSIKWQRANRHFRARHPEN